MAEEDGYPWQPCDYLVEQILNAFACCFSLCDSFCSFCQPREVYQEDDPTTTDGEGDPPTTRAAARRRPRQPLPNEGRGGQIN